MHFLLFILVHWLCTKRSPTELVSRCRGTCWVIAHKLFCAITRDRDREKYHMLSPLFTLSRDCAEQICSFALILSPFHSHMISYHQWYMLCALVFQSMNEHFYKHTHTQHKKQNPTINIRIQCGELGWIERCCGGIWSVQVKSKKGRRHTHIERGGREME